MLTSYLALLAFALFAAAQTFQDPIRNPGADPHIVTQGGYYYLTNTGGTRITVTRSKTLGGLLNGDTKTVWTDTNPARSKQMWAPEMHKIDSIWYIFYTAGDGNGAQRSWVLKGCNTNPYDCNYTFLAQLTPPAGGRGGPNKNDAYSIDGTYLVIKNKRYHVVSAHNAQGVQSINIADLDTTNWTVGPWSVISNPTESWEMADPQPNRPHRVNEGPNPLYHNGTTWLSFSASFCATPAYSLGLLRYDGNGDPKNIQSWSKRGPVLSSANGNFGTGHNVFFSSPDRTEIWNAFHATSNANGSCGSDRYTMAQKVNFDATGHPQLGKPVKLHTNLKVPSGDGQ